MSLLASVANTNRAMLTHGLFIARSMSCVNINPAVLVNIQFPLYKHPRPQPTTAQM